MHSEFERPETARRTRRFAVKLCVCVAILTALFTVGEGLSYLGMKYSAAVEVPAPPASIYQGQAWADAYQREWATRPPNLQYKPYVIWRKGPFAGQTVTIDADGVRKSYYSSCDDAAAYTIWMFGDSTLWGTGVPDWETIPSLVAKKFSDSGRKVCVVNFGETAWASTQEVIELMLSLKQSAKKPEMVIFYNGIIDTYIPYQTDVPDAHFNFARTKQAFESQRNNAASFEYLRQTNTYRALMELRSILSGLGTARDNGRFSPERLNSMAQATYGNYVKNMQLADILGQGYGFRCLFFWQPTLLAGNKPATSDEIRLREREENEHPGIDRVFGATYALLSGYKAANFFDLANIFDQEREARFIDFSHLGPAGNQMIADRMFAVLQQHGT
jgi:lysophospholipase L1-like esterase